MTGQPWLTAEQAIALLVREHEPTINETVEVLDTVMDEDFRPPTLDDQAEDLEWWCNGCHRAANRCTVMPILALVADSSEPHQKGDSRQVRAPLPGDPFLSLPGYRHADDGTVCRTAARIGPADPICTCPAKET